MEKVRVENPNNWMVYVELSNGVVRTVKPHTFLLIDEEEVEWLASSTTFFSEKHLVIVDDEKVEKVGLDPEEVKRLTDDEMAAIMKGKKTSEFHKLVDDAVGNIAETMRIRDIAVDLDLTKSKVNYINEKLNLDI